MTNFIQVFSDKFSLWAATGDVPGTVERNSMMAETPFTDFTMGAVVYTLLVGALVVILLGGGMLILNLGLLSKRSQDRIGERDPSDVGVLKGQTWNDEPDSAPILPAEEEESGLTDRGLHERQRERFKNRGAA